MIVGNKSKSCTAKSSLANQWEFGSKNVSCTFAWTSRVCDRSTREKKNRKRVTNPYKTPFPAQLFIKFPRKKAPPLTKFPSQPSFLNFSLIV
jgi:hypothetical protein